MGVSHCISIGPFIECVYEPQNVYRTLYKCPNDGSHRPKAQDKFCNKCGAAVETSQEDTGDTFSPVDTWEIAEEIDEALFRPDNMGRGIDGTPNAEYWVANRNWGVGRDTDLERYEARAEAFTPELIQGEIEEFSGFFAAELEILRKHYLSVEVKWGLISYCL